MTPSPLEAALAEEINALEARLGKLREVAQILMFQVRSGITTSIVVETPTGKCLKAGADGTCSHPGRHMFSERKVKP